MLDDRDYMRETPAGWRGSATVVLLAISIVACVVQLTVVPPRIVGEYLALSLPGLRQGFVWQLLTYQFLHSGLIHLFLNCWALYVFGREVERVLGKARFVLLYLSSGVVGGLFQALTALIWPAYFNSAVVGASAGVLGIVAAFAMLYPDRVLTLFLFLVLPVNLRAKYLLWLSLGLAALGIAFPRSAFGGDIAHAAHLGGILTGLTFIRLRDELRLRPRGGSPFDFGQPRRQWRKKTALIVHGRPGSDPDSPEDVHSEEFISREVDPILDKISAHGIQSLTERERKILEAARSKMARR